MNLGTINIQNFLSYGEADFDLEKAGLTSVEGENMDDDSTKSNGSGKSGFLDAIVWCLFGTTLRGYENDEVVHRKVGENCLVVMRMHDGAHDYVVTRARKHTKLKNSLRVTRDGEDISGPSNAETQNIVEKILGCSMQTFLSSVVFGQDRAYRFSSLTDSEQKKILDEVLGVERFADACSVARTKMQEINAGIESSKRLREREQQSLAEADEDLADAEKRDASYEEDRAEKLADIAVQIVDAKRQLKKSTQALDKDVTKKAVEKEESKVEQKRAEFLATDNSLIQARARRGEASSRVAEIRAHVIRHERSGSCPTCGQAVDEKKQAKTLGETKKRLKEAERELQDLDDAIKTLSEEKISRSDKLTIAKGLAERARDAHLAAISADGSAKAAAKTVSDLEARLVEVRKATNPYAAIAEKATKRQIKHENEIARINTTAVLETDKLAKFEFWVKAYGAKGLRSLLLDSSLPLLNEEAARISDAITGGMITVEFSATSELKSGKTVDKFAVNTINKQGAGDYRGLSAGEKAKVDLCVGLALQKLVASRSTASFNIMVMDEGLDHLDVVSAERVIEALADVGKESIYVISHNEELRNFMPNSLVIRKEDGFSMVVS